MKYSRNAITQLKRQYKSVLLKCALFNAALIIAAPAMAWYPESSQEVIEGITRDDSTMTSTIAGNVTQSSMDYQAWGTHINNGNFTIGSMDNYGIFNNNEGASVNTEGSIENSYPMSNFSNNGIVNSSDVYNSGIFMNGTEFSSKSYDADGNEVTFDFSDMSSMPDFSTIKSTKYFVNATNSGNISTEGIYNYPNSYSGSGFIPLASSGAIPLGYDSTPDINNPMIYMASGGLFHNNGVIEGDYIDNEGAFYNGLEMVITQTMPEEMGSLPEVSTEFTNYADAKINVRYIYNDDYAVFANGGEITASYIDNEGEFRNTGTINIKPADTTDESFGPFMSISYPQIIENRGNLYNGAGVTRNYAYEDDDDKTVETTTWSLKKLEGGKINGDIVNSWKYGLYGDMSVHTTAAIGLYYSPFRGLVNNGEINGDIYSERMIINGMVGEVSETETYLKEEDDYDWDGQYKLEANPDAVINSNVIYNDDITLNLATINANDIIFNDEELFNGIIPYEYSEDINDAEIFKNAKIKATNGLYNAETIWNAGTIEGNIYNLDDSEGVVLFGGEIKGSILSGDFDEETFNEKFAKFSDYFDDDDWEVTSADEEDEKETTAKPQLFGIVWNFHGENKVSGAIEAEKLFVLENSSLSVGEGIKTYTLDVGSSYDDLYEYYGAKSVEETSTTDKKAAPSRLDIGSGTVNVGTVKFSADSTLALTAESESKYGKVIAGKYDIADGAKLEVTLLSGFSELGKEYSLQFLALDENSELLNVEEDDDDDDNFSVTDDSGLTEPVVADSGSEDSAESGESSEPEKKAGFNNFTDDFSKIDNAMFNIVRDEENEGFYKVTQIKRAEEVAEDNGARPEYTGMAGAWLNTEMPTPESLAMQKELFNLAQNNPSKFVGALKALAPNDTPVTQSVSKAVMGHVFSGVGMHLNKPKSGLASGDALNGVSGWGSAYIGKAKLDDRADDIYGFDAKSKGITVGVDKKVTSATKLGFGLQYDDTDIDAYNSDIDVDTTAAFVYGEYRPNNWFVSGIAAYGRADYDEKNYVGSKIVKANYSADLYGLQGLTGYDIATPYAVITPNAGLRYNYVKRHGYVDGAEQDVSGCNSGVFTGVVGLRAAKNYGGWRPSAYVNFTYDMISERDNSNIALPNGASYSISGKRLNQFATEVGAELQYSYGNWDVAANYDFTGRRHFQSHTGMLTLKYNF